MHKSSVQINTSLNEEVKGLQYGIGSLSSLQSSIFHYLYLKHEITQKLLLSYLTNPLHIIVPSS